MVSWTLLDSLKHHYINVKELFPITVALETWGHSLQNSSVLFFSDNEAVVAVINKQTSKDKDMMVLLRTLVVAALKFNVHFKSKHIPGKYNILADHCLVCRSNVFTARRRIWTCYHRHSLCICSASDSTG